MVFAMLLERLSLNVHVTGFADYCGCYSGTCTADKPTEGYIEGETVERYRRINGSTTVQTWMKLGDGYLAGLRI